MPGPEAAIWAHETARRRGGTEVAESERGERGFARDKKTIGLAIADWTAFAAWHAPTNPSR
jgi:hypothetical protein